MSKIELKNLTKRFSEVTAVDAINLSIDEGEFLTLLGPSGCGKTTTLRCISGLEKPEEGEIVLGGKTVFSSKKGINVSPGKRDLGLVFQNYALWPHMSVAQNISFGLRYEKLSHEEVKTKVAHILDMVGLGEYGERYPHELSGGQQQRVAVARMVVTEPDIFLFDEPLSNLDAKLRMTLRAELKRMHHILNATSIYVTHDQVEALTLSTRIVVMDNGVIQQVGTPYEVYHYPKNLFVAEFMGNPRTNLLRAKVVSTDPRSPVFEFDTGERCGLPFHDNPGLEGVDEVIVNIRPEDISIDRSGAEPEQGCGGISARVYTTLPAGSEALTYLRNKKDEEIIAKGEEEQHRGLEPEAAVTLKFKRGNVYHSGTGELIESFAEAGE